MEHKKTRGLWMVTVRDRGHQLPNQTGSLSHQLKAKERCTEPKRPDNDERRK